MAKKVKFKELEKDNFNDLFDTSKIKIEPVKISTKNPISILKPSIEPEETLEEILMSIPMHGCIIDNRTEFYSVTTTFIEKSDEKNNTLAHSLSIEEIDNEEIRCKFIEQSRQLEETLEKIYGYSTND